MSKVKKLTKILMTLAKNPYRLSRILDSDYWKDYVIKKYGCNEGLPTIDLLDLFPQFEETVTPYSYLEGTSDPIDIALLRSLARKFDHCRYLEIGTWRGESVANVAPLVDECITISLSEEEMEKEGLSNQFISVHRFFSKRINNIKHISHNSHTFNFSTLGGRFDLVFVDGDHRYQGVKCDTQNVFKILHNDRSVIVWHDYGYNPERVRWEVLAGILDGCPKEKGCNLYHVSNTLCAIYMKGDFKTRNASFPDTPNKSFRLKLLAIKIK